MTHRAQIITIRGKFAIESTTKDRENKPHGRFQRNQAIKNRGTLEFTLTENHIDVILVPRC